MATIETGGEHASFGGRTGFYSHRSEACDGEMRFTVFMPPQPADGPVPVLYYLAALTCTEETFMIKGGARRLAAKHGLMLVSPDANPLPRGETEQVGVQIPPLPQRPHGPRPPAENSARFTAPSTPNLPTTRPRIGRSPVSATGLSRRVPTSISTGAVAGG